jgi:hypothetical protein
MSSSLMGDVTLRWVVTMLFGASIATYVYILVARRGRWTSTVNHLLHLVMSLAMILMAWGVGMSLPTVGPMIFFLLAGVWFAGAAGRMSTATGDRLTNGYYAVMMAAMAWMFVAMNGKLPSRLGHSSDHAQSAAAAIDMSATDVPAHEMSPAEPAAEWIVNVNTIAALGFAVVALYWACRYLAKRRVNVVPQTRRLAHFEPLYQACTAAGTALMFGALL